MARIKTDLPPELQAAWEEIEGYARNYNLDFYPIIYQVLDYRTLYEVAALGGFPTRYPHWRFGMEFDQLIKGHTYGLSVIYEMVINNNPVYAYLLEGNALVDQKTVMAHVCGHADFFKHNLWFAHTNRKMLDSMANHATRIRRIVDRYGYELVEDFVDTCLSLENLIDYHAPYIRRPEAETELSLTDEEEIPTVEGLPVERTYMKNFINPPEFLDRQKQRLEEERQRLRKFPENAQKDILLFLLNYAPLERWQHTILEIIRDEAYYFAPQGMTKILNEGWACLTGGLMLTSQGLLDIRQVVMDRLALQASDGRDLQEVYDWAIFRDRETVKVRTQRGLELEGSTTHRVMLPDGQWRRLDELQVGQQVLISGGQNVWAEQKLPVSWHAPRRWTRQVGAARAAAPLAAAVGAARAPLAAEHEAAVAVVDRPGPAGALVRVPQQVDERLGAFLGYLLGSGSSSRAGRVIAFSSDSHQQASDFARLAAELFGIGARLTNAAGRWRATVPGGELKLLLKQLGIKAGFSARSPGVPDVILRSPKTVVAAFLRTLYDCAGHAEDTGVALSVRSAELSKVVQLLLLNFGILSTRQAQHDGGWHVQASGPSAAVFAEEIGFGLPHKQSRLLDALGERRWLNEEWLDRIVAIERGRADVYDVSVAATHRYVAQGLVNHNSYWHSEIMTKKAARASEIVDFADHHAGVVAVSPGRLNPYKLGLELLRDVEERWNKGRFGKEWEECENLEAKRHWDMQLGLGRKKLFEVRRFHNDVTFIDEFLTPEFCLEQKLFTFRYNRDTDLYEIASREFQEIKRKLLFRLTNFGQPFIYIEDGNYHNRGELYLKHRHEGVDLKMDYARDTMRNLYKIWTRPVHLETVVDEKRRLLTFDGRDYSERKMD